MNDDDLVCPHCQEGQVMTQSHCMVCPAWAELREGLDMTDITNLAMYFILQEVVDREGQTGCNGRCLI